MRKTIIFLQLEIMEIREREIIKRKIQAAILVAEEDIRTLEELTKPIAPDNAVGRLSRMEAINTKSINESTLRTARSKLAQLKYALANIDEPDFGICMDCGETIAAGRIMIMPESNLCIDCAE
ncbi:TraR/DksA family transcriptional regulator [Thermodesulfobacteriota bacterium]